MPTLLLMYTSPPLPALNVPVAARLVVVALSIVAPPTTSSLESVEVEVKPMSAWSAAVVTRMPDPLKCVQLMSEPEAPESVPQEKVPPAHSSLSAEVLQEEDR